MANGESTAQKKRRAPVRQECFIVTEREANPNQPGTKAGFDIVAPAPDITLGRKWIQQNAEEGVRYRMIWLRPEVYEITEQTKKRLTVSKGAGE